MADFTFAVVGRNEAETLHIFLGQALEAAGPGDRVWYIDGESSDDSVERAAAMGAEVIAAPVGKGRAMQHAIELCGSGYICFGDADLMWSENNICSVLKQAAIDTDADMVIGHGQHPVRVRSVNPGIWVPLAGYFFPHLLDSFSPFPVSGYRVFRADQVHGPLPPGYGIETHLNLLFAYDDRSVVAQDFGEYEGPLRGYRNIPLMSLEVADATLDFAEREGLLDPALRPEWDAWVEVVLEVIRTKPGDDGPPDGYAKRLEAAAARPLPPAKLNSAASTVSIASPNAASENGSAELRQASGSN
jgi:glycosyltransferase involved in cell wall biosynthesis